MRVQLSLILILLIGCAHKVRIVAPTTDRPRIAHEAKASDVMVTTQGGATTRASLHVINQGGNIIDAFVAASFAISVERPHSTGLGGGGFLLYFDKASNQVYAFDFREIAPHRSRTNMYLTKKDEVQPTLSQDGALAVATPGLVRGLFDIHKRFGKLPWKDCIEPAVKIAREGFPLYPQLQEALIDRKDVLWEDAEARGTFFTKEGTVPLLGTLIYQENLAKTLEKIGREGAPAFYEGEIASAIVKTIRDRQGIMTHKDLREYRMSERTPVTGNYKGLKIFSMPPPSSGGIHVIQILKMLEPYDLKAMKPQSSEAVHLMANAMQKAFLDRAMYLGDPDFNKIPTDQLVF